MVTFSITIKLKMSLITDIILNLYGHYTVIYDSLGNTPKIKRWWMK